MQFSVSDKHNECMHFKPRRLGYMWATLLKWIKFNPSLDK